MSAQFWMVWNPARNPPSFRHGTEPSAQTEAERLARLNPGERFFVLEAVRMVLVDNMQRVDLRPRNGFVDDLPF